MKPDAKLHCPDPGYLRELVARSGLSQRETARRIGVGDRQLRSWLCLGNCPYTVQYALEQLAGASPDRRRDAISSDP